ncbi:polysaccharide deacetylase family protein [Thermoanaerobacterium sp. RBIITD]|uniref:polysaccharide deacetylase family protein n=1 Tax=Thermoanaerobacterium sp. RBIITD TaxID=1550240 RepID=UPI000BB812D0|nr:polysaccharide deacetylase family protein [Thermoanaerobacterium sp. RBIITD]SNX53390.1 Polysaccharide deacetylase [Thermoanaerobacterium sp. RBIITD]
MKVKFNYYPGGKRKALTMSYDDGQIFDRKLIEIFNKYGIKGTFNLNSGNFDREPFINSSEIKDLYKNHEVAVHSLNHPYLTLIPLEDLAEQILEDRKNLETLVGYQVRGMAYPFGDYNDILMKSLPSFGIEYSRTTISTRGFKLPNNFLEWHPTCHHNQDLIEKWKEFKNSNDKRQMLLFYVWGHSYEFNNHNNWNAIEEFCKMASSDESVWFATNIEIVDYINALKNLKFSVDRKIITNPSSIPVWIDVDGESVKINSGETVYFK